MRFSKYFRTAAAGFLSMAMAVTLIPAGSISAVQAAVTNSNMVLHWDMTGTDNTLTDLTGNNHEGVMNAPVSKTKIDNIDVLDMTGGYVDIPDGTITEDMTAVTVNMLVKISENVPASWMFCLGSSNKRYLYFTGCCSAGQGSVMRGGVGCVPTEILSTGNGWDYEAAFNGNVALKANEWQNITITYKDGGEMIFYRNGEKVASKEISIKYNNEDYPFTLQDLMTAGDERDGYMGWSFYTGQDPKFQGKVADFRIYNDEMSAEEVSALNTSMENMLNGLANNDFSAENVDLKNTDCLGTNTDANNITDNLVLPKTTTITINGTPNNASITGWKSSNTAVITDDGVVTKSTSVKTVTMTATVTMNGISVEKALTFKVARKATDAEIVKMDQSSFTLNGADDVRGNITLPTETENGSKITWASSNESIVSSKPVGEMAAGVVNRPSKDTTVKLTATFTSGKETATKDIDVVVKAAPAELQLTDYLFAYFPYAGVKNEKIYFASSEDGLNFTTLNEKINDKGEVDLMQSYVLESTLGTHGLRDPFIIRSHEGDRFFLIATDLTVAGIEQNGVNYPGMGWTDNQRIGSKSIMVWESEDLVNWSNQRMCRVSVDEAGCTWAPEAYYDDATGQYVVFWASKTGTDNYAKQRVYYATTRDFTTFSKAQVWIEGDQSVIDTTVVKGEDGYYYRFTKNEGGSNNSYGTPSKRIFCEKSDSMLGEWTLVNANSLPVSGGQIEGPSAFKFNAEDVDMVKKLAEMAAEYHETEIKENGEVKKKAEPEKAEAIRAQITDGEVLYGLYPDQTGSTIIPGITNNVSDGLFACIGQTANMKVGESSIYDMPEPAASHGTVMPITSQEYNNIMLKWDTDYRTAAEDFVAAAEDAEKSLTLNVPAKVTSNITLPTKGSNGATITWSSSDPLVISNTGVVARQAEDAVVALTATIKVDGGEVTVGEKTVNVRDQIKTKVFTVTVEKKASSVAPATTVKVTKVSATPASKTVTVGDSFTIKSTITPSNASNKAVSYTSSAPSVAAVNASGKVTAKKAGTAKITVKAKDGSGKKAVVTVTVKAKGSLKVSGKSKITLKVKKSTKLTATAKNLSGKITWKITKGKKFIKLSAATGSKVRIKAVKKGTAKVKISCGGKSVTKTIVVKK